LYKSLKKGHAVLIIGASY